MKDCKGGSAVLPVISVIVPVYDAQAYLDRCISSIIHQTYRNLEIILVDDGARDKSPEICDAYAVADDRIRVIHKKNGGLISAWMAGVTLSTGSYLSFVDSDDWVETDMMEEMLKFAPGQAGEVICGNFVIEKPGRTTCHYHGLVPGEYTGEELVTKVKEQLLGNENRTVSLSRCMKLFARELITENMKYCNSRIRMGEDVNIVLPALIDSKRIVVLKDALHYHYFFNQSSMVHKYDPDMYENIRELVDTIQKIYLDKPLQGWEKQLGKEKQYLLMLAVKNELRGGRKGYVYRVAEICKREETGALFENYPIETVNKANRILGWVMRRPGRLRIVTGKIAFEMYDKISRMRKQTEK